MDRKITKEEKNKLLRNGFRKWSVNYFAKRIDKEKYKIDIYLNICEDEWYMLYEMSITNCTDQCGKYAAFFYVPTLNDIFKIIKNKNKWIEDGYR